MSEEMIKTIMAAITANMPKPEAKKPEPAAEKPEEKAKRRENVKGASVDEQMKRADAIEADKPVEEKKKNGS